MQPPREGYVYRIIAPGSNSVYVGQSVNPIERFGQHKRKPSNPALAKFLKKHYDAEIYYWPVFDMDAEEIEDERLCREMGFNLLNCIPCGRPPSTLGMTFTPEACANISAALVGRKFTPEHCAKLSAARSGQKASPVAREHMSAAQRGRKHTPETRKRISAANTGKKFSPEHLENQSASQTVAQNRPETAAKKSAALKGKTPWNKGKRR